jgi:D-alanine--D-alanine ligase
MVVKAHKVTRSQSHKEMFQFGRVGVLMGGPSSEREISLKSGKAVYEALKKSGLQVAAIDIKTDSFDKNTKLIKSHKINCAFVALHGRFGEDGQIQRILEKINIPYTGSGVLASKLAMDKIASRKIFKAAGLKVPKYKVLDKPSYSSGHKIYQGLKFPLVIKPATHGSSIGLSIINAAGNLKKALDLAFSFDDRVIIEEHVKGREVTVGILEEKALPVIEIIPKKIFFDYEAKYIPGMTEYVIPAKLERKIAQGIKEAALSAHKLLGCFACSRADIILDKGNSPVILEVNTIPGFTSTSLLPKAAKTQGIGFEALCIKLIRLAYEKK